ncbi:MAG: MBL fold metallo-hydrolase [Lentisphaeria bacterium]|nr:MBL fold metallo-hydrolase [Lentisphaeria bacterium]
MLKKVWEYPVAPFRVFGNLYFVGIEPASTHLIDTGAGLIVIDPGYPESLYIVLESIRRLGFDPMKIKYIVLTHGHYDHLGAALHLQKLCGGETFIGRPDRDYANGTRDLTWAKELGYASYESAFEPDHLLDDGDKITLGGTTITARLTPGHTEGTLSFFFDVSDGVRTLRAGMHGGVGMNSLSGAFLKSHGLPMDLQKQFLAGLDLCRKEKVEVFLGNHVGQNDTLGKGKRVLAGEKDAFIDPKGWLDFLDKSEKRMRDLMAKEQAEGSAQ